MVDVLVIEDHVEIGTLLCDFLKKAGYCAALCLNAEDGLSLFAREGARMVLLDIMLPGMDGFAVCQRLREISIVPILILSAKVEKDAKLNALILGADDYIEKPFDMDLLMAKINGIFQRRCRSDCITCGKFKIDKKRRCVYKDGNELKMTAKEYDLLTLLVENCHTTLSKEAIFNHIWGFESDSEPQTLTVHIKWLREKIESDVKRPRHIITVWGVGYRFEE